ncbi:hypothetical protein V2H45_20195 [Tumidithrix elongata RA019]|uniref:Uncharacterized protein n=1 Tax=Tumidithrix elongata BACA0141 TaxID=2716417 RepID=A0AAW9Q5A0_9CYAN|nr:hypothetical protein [Tumidithrix elongata RA019]
MSSLFPNEPEQPEATTSLVPSSHTIYAVLGFLQEYSGRYVSQDDLVEHFFADETAKAQIFEQYLLRLIEEQKMQLDLHSVVSQGHTYFHSKELVQQGGNRATL